MKICKVLLHFLFCRGKFCLKNSDCRIVLTHLKTLLCILDTIPSWISWKIYSLLNRLEIEIKTFCTFHDHAVMIDEQLPSLVQGIIMIDQIVSCCNTVYCSRIRPARNYLPLILSNQQFETCKHYQIQANNSHYASVHVD